MDHFGRLLACSIVLAVASPGRASGQELRGTVRDSVSKKFIAGAVVTLVDDRGAAPARRLTDEHGQYRLVVSVGPLRLRVVRIGFRPVSMSVAHSAAIDTVDVVMTPVPTLLEPVSVRANASCPRTADEGAALGLLEQARATLLNTVVASESNPADITLLRFVRSIDGTSDRITGQKVHFDSTSRVGYSFKSMRSAADFVRRGFVEDLSDGRAFHAPDADVLLADDFAAAYCFRIVKGNRDRPGDVGLGFTAPNRIRNRIDVDGVLWVDTTSRRLRQIDFRYVGLDRALNPAKPGGWLSFYDLPSGVVIIDRWSLRLAFTKTDRSPPPLSVLHDAAPRHARTWIEVQELGGEVAQIAAPGQPVWNAPLGTLRVHVLTHAQQPAVGARAWLLGTEHRPRADSSGNIVINHLLPGEYRLVVIDSQLEPLGITLATPVNFTAVRDSVHRAAIELPTADDYVFRRCRDDGNWNDLDRKEPKVVWMLGRVVDPDGTPVERATAAVSKADTTASAAVDSSAAVERSKRTGKDGIFELCPATFRVGDLVNVEISRRDVPPIRFQQRLTDSLTILPLVRLEKRPPP